MTLPNLAVLGVHQAPGSHCEALGFVEAVYLSAKVRLLSVSIFNSSYSARDKSASLKNFMRPLALKAEDGAELVWTTDAAADVPNMLSAMQPRACPLTVREESNP
jgi:hypothetical protein